MIEYQNIFTQVQVQGKPEWGMDDSDGELTAERAGKPFFSKFLGLFGQRASGTNKRWYAWYYFCCMFYDLVQYCWLFNVGTGRLVCA